MNDIWALKPYYLSPCTLRVQYRTCGERRKACTWSLKCLCKHLSYSLNSFNGVVQGIIRRSIIGNAKEDSRSFGYSLSGDWFSVLTQ